MLNLSIPDHVIPLRARVLDFIEREIYPLESTLYEETPESRRGLMRALMQSERRTSMGAGSSGGTWRWRSPLYGLCVC